MIISQLLREASQQLAEVSDSPRLDAETLLAHALERNRTWLMTWSDQVLENEQLTAFNRLLQRRLQGEPVAHITQQREFWSLPLSINAHTLIPRPETELLVEQLLERYPDETTLSLLDLGTGSGAIALALASERPTWSITAVERSPGALEVARYNGERLKLHNIQWLEGSWFEPVAGQHFDIIASNPPYIPSSDPHLKQGDVRFEPRTALAAGDDGLDDIRHICALAGKHLKPGGLLIIEHGYDQKNAVFDEFDKNCYTNIHQLHDLAGQPRLTLGIFPT